MGIKQYAVKFVVNDISVFDSHYFYIAEIISPEQAVADMQRRHAISTSYLAKLVYVIADLQCENGDYAYTYCVPNPEFPLSQITPEPYQTCVG